MSLTPDDQEWLAQVERYKDALKVAITSNGRVDPMFLAAESSVIESSWKRIRLRMTGENE